MFQRGEHAGDFTREHVCDLSAPIDLNVADLKHHLNWYGKSPENVLRIFLDGRGCKTSVCEEARNLIELARSLKPQNRDAPELALLCSLEGLDVEFLSEIDRLDCRLPRLVVVVVIDAFGFPSDWEAKAKKLSELMQSAGLLRKWVIEFDSPCEPGTAASTCELVQHALNVESVGAIIPFCVRDEGLCGVIEELFDTAIIDPEILSYCPSNFLTLAYCVQECWYMDQILDTERSNFLFAGGAFSEGDPEINTGFAADFYESLSFEKYHRWRRSENKVVLDFDVESISDSLECQSPVFINSKWLTKGAVKTDEQ